MPFKIDPKAFESIAEDFKRFSNTYGGDINESTKRSIHNAKPFMNSLKYLTDTELNKNFESIPKTFGVTMASPTAETFIADPTTYKIGDTSYRTDEERLLLRNKGMLRSDLPEDGGIFYGAKPTYTTTDLSRYGDIRVNSEVPEDSMTHTMGDSYSNQMWDWNNSDPVGPKVINELFDKYNAGLLKNSPDPVDRASHELLDNLLKSGAKNNADMFDAIDRHLDYDTYKNADPILTKGLDSANGIYNQGYGDPEGYDQRERGWKDLIDYGVSQSSLMTPQFISSDSIPKHLQEDDNPYPFIEQQYFGSMKDVKPVSITPSLDKAVYDLANGNAFTKNGRIQGFVNNTMDKADQYLGVRGGFDAAHILANEWLQRFGKFSPEQLRDLNYYDQYGGLPVDMDQAFLATGAYHPGYYDSANNRLQRFLERNPVPDVVSVGEPINTGIGEENINKLNSVKRLLGLQ